MTGEHIREEMLDLMTGEPTAEQAQHLASCPACAQQLKELRGTMALMDEWKAPEVSPYFDPKLRAKLRAEQEAAPRGWFAWMRTPQVMRPVAAAVFTLVIVAGVGLYRYGNGPVAPPTPTMAVVTAPPKAAEGSAVSDLQMLDKDEDALALLDDSGVSQ